MALLRVKGDRHAREHVFMRTVVVKPKT